MAVRACYVAVPLYVCGFLALGTAFQKHNSVVALIMGWGIAQVAIMVNTVAVCASLCDLRSTRESFKVNLLRCLRQRLLPETPGRD